MGSAPSRWSVVENSIWRLSTSTLGGHSGVFLSLMLRAANRGVPGKVLVCELPINVLSASLFEVSKTFVCFCSSFWLQCSILIFLIFFIYFVDLPKNLYTMSLKTAKKCIFLRLVTISVPKKIPKRNIAQNISVRTGPSRCGRGSHICAYLCARKGR